MTPTMTRKQPHVGVSAALAPSPIYKMLFMAATAFPARNPSEAVIYQSTHLHRLSSAAASTASLRSAPVILAADVDPIAAAVGLWRTRESVKMRAIKFQHKHARCIADGNELLRFHGTTISCSLGVNGSSSLCCSPNCNGCQILRRGFPTKWEMKAGVGVFTASTWERAFESIGGAENEFSAKKAVLVCRVIAGRVHKPIDCFREMIGLLDFDSVAGKVGLHSNLEELYLLNPRALLPCFVVID